MFEWIPVDEKLPEKEGKYLVSYEWPYGSDSSRSTYKGIMFEVAIAWYTNNLHELDPEQFPKERHYECPGFVEILDDESGKKPRYACYSDLTAWMPLPDPYKHE